MYGNGQHASKSNKTTCAWHEMCFDLMWCEFDLIYYLFFFFEYFAFVLLQCVCMLCPRDPQQGRWK